MEELLIGTESKKASVWDNFIPIVKNKKRNKYTVYLFDSIEAPGNYSELIHLLLNAKEGSKIKIHINNYGGVLDSAMMIRNAIKQSKATVEGILDGTVASAATVIALSCDSLTVNDNIAWLSHNYSTGMQGKGGELKSQMEFNNTVLAESFRDIHKNFLTNEEIESILEDKDIWLSSEEVKTRWNKYAKMKK